MKKKVLLKGKPGNKGRVRGKVKVFKSPIDFEKFERGDILVIPLSNPLYTPVLIRAGAIITDKGGVLSHAAIVAREMGIPCVVGADKATEILQDDIIVTVDGKEGIVYVQEEIKF